MSPYAYCMDNPIKYIDPLGLDSAQRANAVNKSEEYVNQNPGNSYKMGAKGEPGEKVDCSGMASKCIVAGGENDPVTKPNASGNGVTRIENSSTEVNLQKAQVGNVIVLDDSHHIGIITKVLTDKNGKVTGYEFNDSGGDPSSGKSGPRSSTAIIGKNYWGERITGVYKWDTKPDSPTNSPISSPTSSVTSSNQSEFKQGPFSLGNWIMNNTKIGTGAHEIGRTLMKVGF